MEEEFVPKKKIKIFTKEFYIKYSYVFILALILLLGTSFSLTFFTQNMKIASGSLTTAPLDITFSNNSVSASNLSVPSDNQEGLSEFIKTLTITNNGNTDGKVKLTLSRTSGLELTDMSYALVVNGAIQTIGDVPSDGVILNTAIMASEIINVELRLWPKTTYSGNVTTFVGEIDSEIRYLGAVASSNNNLTNAYVNFNCSGNNCEVWRIVKVESNRLVLTREADLTGADQRTNSGVYNPNLTFNDNSMITSVSTDNKNVYLAKTVKIKDGEGTQASPYNLINNIEREPDKKVIAAITYKNGNDTVGTQYIYYNETNYISQEVDDSGFQEWTDGTNDYVLGDTINFTTDTILTAKIVQTLKNRIMSLCNDNSVTFVQKYDAVANGAAIDTPDGSGNEDVCYYTSDPDGNRNSIAEQNGNVIFGDYCWQIVRTTADGGVKLIYNGQKTANDTCTSDADTTNYSNDPRPTSIGIIGTSGTSNTAISGNKKYGTSFEIFVDENDNNTNKFRLKNVEQLSWSENDTNSNGKKDYEEIIGKYVCGTSSSPTGADETCTVLYYVGHYQSRTQASTTKYTIGNNAHYSQIGTSAYNAYYDNPALVGYMYNDVYTFKSKTLITSQNVINQTYMSTSTAYYYGDTATWVTDHYELTVGGVTPSSTTTWSNIRNTVGGMYTCLNTTDTSCAIVYYAVANQTSTYLYTVPLSNNEDINTKTVTWTIGTGYEENNDVYSLTGTSTLTFTLKDWYTNYSNSQYKNYYICDNLTNSTCTNEVYYVGETTNSQILYSKSSNSYVFGNSVSYNNGEYIIDTDSDPTKYQTIWNWYVNYNTINNSHYTCFENYNSATGSCGGTVYFVYYTNSTSANYIKLSNNERIDDAIQKMLNKDNSNLSQVNRYNSSIKGAIDSWYESNLSSLSSYLDNDAVFCNDRTITSYGGWSTSGNTASNYQLKFKYNIYASRTNATLGCTNVTDRFSKSNTKAELSYPVGILSEAERAMMYSGYARTDQNWWLGSPYNFNTGNVGVRYSGTFGSFGDTSVYIALGLRPVIVLKPGIEISSGNGSYSTPYIINTTNP